MGFPKIEPTQLFWIWGHFPMGQKWGGAKSTPHVGPLVASCPLFGFGLLKISGVVG